MFERHQGGDRAVLVQLDFGQGSLAADLAELKELANRPAGSVSGGQGKMVALGRALMLGTRLLILDEPFQGLAPVLAQRYAEALRRLRSQDKDITLLITESNPKLLETFADVTLTIERGEIESRQLSE